MRLIMECEHEKASDSLCLFAWCLADRTITDPDAIVEVLAEAGVLFRQNDDFKLSDVPKSRYVSPWKEAK